MYLTNKFCFICLKERSHGISAIHPNFFRAIDNRKSNLKRLLKVESGSDSDLVLAAKKQGLLLIFSSSTKKTTLQGVVLFTNTFYCVNASHPRAFKAIFVLARVTK
jgi:hypothetical protein